MKKSPIILPSKGNENWVRGQQYCPLTETPELKHETKIKGRQKADHENISSTLTVYTEEEKEVEGDEGEEWKKRRVNTR